MNNLDLITLLYSKGVKMLNPFHLSFVVPDRDEAKRFYTNILGCEIGRDNGHWFDIIFFGHQITIHQETEKMHSYTIDHFGPVLTKEDWLAISQRLEAANIEYVARPLVKTDAYGNKSGKYLIKDPAGNILEFKYYENLERTLTENTEHI